MGLANDVPAWLTGSTCGAESSDGFLCTLCPRHCGPHRAYDDQLLSSDEPLATWWSVTVPSVASDGLNGSREVHSAPDAMRDVVGQLRAENAHLRNELAKARADAEHYRAMYRSWT